MNNFEMDVRRLAFIQKIVDRAVDSHGDIGKTKVQKISYFLQEAVGIPLNYRFRMHYFGPYSNDLDNTLSLSEALGYVEIKPDPNGFGFHVTPGQVRENTWFQDYEMEKDTDADVEFVDDVIDILAGLQTHILELYATVHLLAGPNGNMSKDEALSTVGKVKPKFSADTIEDAYDALRGASLI